MDSEIYEICLSSLQWARERDYKGYDPYDGLNSPILNFVARNWFTRLVAIHGVNKAPINLRPLLRVPKERNPKGIALFATAYLNIYEQTGDNEFLNEAESLLQWLVENQSTAFELPCWGYNFDWQNGRKFFLPTYHPSIVVTVFCGRAFHKHYTVTQSEQSLEVALDAADFIQKHINTKIIGECEVYTYTPYDSFVVINANALAADYFYQLAPHRDDGTLQQRAEGLFSFVCEAQNDEGAWYYAMPTSGSHLSHDNFHTGFILESLYEYGINESDNDCARKAYNKGLEFYRQNLFDANGAPRFEAKKRYPYDAHAASQAILTFVQRGNSEDREIAQKVCDWSINNLFDKDGYFYRRSGRVLTDKTPYIRWSQAWMACALAVYLSKTD